MFLKTRKGFVALLAVAAGMLSACGGGGGAEVETSSPARSSELQQVESRVQTAGAVQDLSPLRQRAKSATGAPKATLVALGPLTQTKAQIATFEPGVAMQVGEARSISQTATAVAMQEQFQWQATPDGGRVGAINFAAEGATGVRLGVLVRQLPGSAILRVYSQSRPNEVFQISGQEVLQRIDTNIRAGDTSDEGRTWWTPYLGYADATLEVELPPGVQVSSLDIAVPRLSHLFVDLRTLAATGDSSAKVGESDFCEVDANCIADLQNERNAVARMIFVQSGGTYVCTGTLLNDLDSTGIPYFLSANHCISNQTVASSLITTWFYRSASCGSSSVLASSSSKFGGATLLYASGTADTSFMRLNDTPPVGAVFAGWSIRPIALGTAVSALHHPSGDLLKYARGAVGAHRSCTVSGGVSCSTATSSTGSHYRVDWSQGVTEGGSSGSGIFQNGKLIGVLSGGASQCSAAASSMYDYYGRFDVAYAASLNKWLAASGNGGQGRAAVYRFYNAGTGAHFFTSSAAERNSVFANLPAFNYEGIAFYAPVAQQASTSPVFRFYNQASGAHFYTVSAAERDYVIGSLLTYKYEGPSWYGRTEAGDNSTAIYRFYNARRNVHFYTISAAERDYVIANNPEYQYENAAYYAWTSR